MNLLKKTAISIMMISVFSLNLPAWVFAQPDILLAKENISEHKPMILTTPEIKIPVEKKARKKINKWVWVGLGALAVGGAAAAAAGGSDDGGDENRILETDTGDVTVRW